ncbi:hypothetical protein VCHA43O270_70160 [Vibrio chagasii]|nr:hypothetical protein VCHA34P115_100157 [Vibrio chagasii]CAH7177641.1 hypothetical protein VCHA57P511_120121 [Vibrio chagasii]CAH7408266.1 hypothetical protein VCHA43O270_70160 [Vibrio chagasii]
MRSWFKFQTSQYALTLLECASNWKPYRDRIIAVEPKILLVGAKPKGGSVPKFSLLVSNSKLKSAASLKVAKAVLAVF